MMWISKLFCSSLSGILLIQGGFRRIWKACHNTAKFPKFYSHTLNAFLKSHRLFRFLFTHSHFYSFFNVAQMSIFNTFIERVYNFLWHFSHFHFQLPPDVKRILFSLLFTLSMWSMFIGTYHPILLGVR